jgi:hypothetical protein
MKMGKVFLLKNDPLLLIIIFIYINMKFLSFFIYAAIVLLTKFNVII